MITPALVLGVMFLIFIVLIVVAEVSRENIKNKAIKDFTKELMQNLDGEIEDYANAGHSLNVYAWLNYYLRSKGAIETEDQK